jgi:hypothetical protein
MTSQVRSRPSDFGIQRPRWVSWDELGMGPVSPEVEQTAPVVVVRVRFHPSRYPSTRWGRTNFIVIQFELNDEMLSLRTQAEAICRLFESVPPGAFPMEGRFARRLNDRGEIYYDFVDA